MKYILLLALSLLYSGCSTTDSVEITQGPTQPKETLSSTKDINVFRVANPEIPAKVIKLAAVEFPKNYNETLEAKVQFIIAGDGNVISIHILEINDDSLKELLTDTIKRSEFSPAIFEGKPIATRVIMPIKIDPNQAELTTPDAVRPPS